MYNMYIYTFALASSARSSGQPEGRSTARGVAVLQMTSSSYRVV